jgi:ribosomal protein S18 acetylase RimI-like enzyme
LKTGDAGQDATGLIDEKLLGHYYAAPYVHFEPDLCWLLVKQAIPVGYILGTSDSGAFAAWADKKWWGSLRQLYPLKGENGSWTQQMISLLHEGYRPPSGIKAYPAHLHIDLLPEGQKQGWGKVLISLLCQELKKMSVAGVHLEVSKGNTNAIGFYKSTGFSVLKSGSSFIRFGKSL